MESFLIKALQLILSLSILVVIHELGHFLFARLFKIRVEKFYLFFDPWFSLFKFKPKGGDTEYGIGWLPLGGYVKISGMIDESMDKEQMAQPPKAWEFRSKPAWQRLLVMAGGVLFNFVLAIFILSMMIFALGDSYVPYKDIKNGMSFSEVATQAGFKDKDILISADGKDMLMRSNVLEMNTMMDFVRASEVVVERNGKLQTITLPETFGDEIIASKKSPYEICRPVVVDSIVSGRAAEQAGLQVNDSLVAVNGVEALSFNKFVKELDKYKGKATPITLYRNGEMRIDTVEVDTAGTIGFLISHERAYNFKLKTDNYGFFASFPVGLTRGVETLKGYVAQARFVFSKEGAKNIGGFGAIGGMFTASWNWEHFWAMTAFLSIALGVMNILPIPALDGGHIMFLLYEVVARRKPNEKFMEYATMAGMFLLLGVILFANGNDLLRAIFG